MTNIDLSINNLYCSNIAEENIFPYKGNKIFCGIKPSDLLR